MTLLACGTIKANVCCNAASWITLSPTVRIYAPSAANALDRVMCDLGEGHYATLRLSESATAGEIRSVFRKMSLQYHPDKQGVGASPRWREKTSEMFFKLSEAHEVLSDPEKRAAYDESSRIERLMRSAAGRVSSSMSWSQRYAHRSDSLYEHLSSLISLSRPIHSMVVIFLFLCCAAMFIEATRALMSYTWWGIKSVFVSPKQNLEKPRTQEERSRFERERRAAYQRLQHITNANRTLLRSRANGKR